MLYKISVCLDTKKKRLMTDLSFRQAIVYFQRFKERFSSLEFVIEGISSNATIDGLMLDDLKAWAADLLEQPDGCFKRALQGIESELGGEDVSSLDA